MWSCGQLWGTQQNVCGKEEWKGNMTEYASVIFSNAIHSKFEVLAQINLSGGQG